MKFINDMSEIGKKKLGDFLNEKLKNVYDLEAYIDDVLEDVTQNNDELRYELDLAHTKSSLPESIQFDESDFEWKEMEEEE